jgi:hypothetical protein
MKTKETLPLPSCRFGRSNFLFRSGNFLFVCVVFGTLLSSTPLSAQDSKTEGEWEHPEHGSLSAIGSKLSNPVSDVWALFTEFDLNFSDGDINQGDAKVGGRMLFQTTMPPGAAGSTPIEAEDSRTDGVIYKNDPSSRR